MNRPERGHSFRGLSFRGTAARLGVPNLNLGRLRPRIRKRTLALVSLAVLVIAAIAGWTVLRQTALIRQTLEAQLSESFGAQVSIERVEWDGWSTIVAEGLTLRVPGWDSPADEVASIKHAVVTFRPTGLLGGRLSLEDMEIDGLTLRLVERVDAPGVFNFLALKPKPGGSSTVEQPRKAIMSNLRLELGVLREGKLEIVARRAFEGSFEHSPDDPSLYSFELAQTEEDGHKPEGAPVRIFGTWDERTFAYEATMDSLHVGPGLLALLPLEARTWAQRAGLTGHIDSARISGNPSDPVSFGEVRVRDVTFRERDVVRSVPWARLVGDEIYPIRGDVSVRLPRGVLSVRGSRLDIWTNDARIMPGPPGSGAVEIPVELRFGLNLDADDSRPFNWDVTEEWLTGALASAAFDLRVKLTGVSAMPLADGQARPVELPDVVIQALRDFGLRDWLADIDLAVSRARGVKGEDGMYAAAPLNVQGRLALSEGSVRYRAFPYPINRIKGQIEFDGKRARITDLVGHGSGNAMLRVNGTVDALSSDPGFEFQVVGTEIPVNDDLLDSVHGATARIFAGIFDREAYKSLRAAGVADDSMAPSGLVDIDMKVSHALNGGENTVLVGNVNVREACVVLNAFPFPMRVHGTLEIQDEAVVLTNGGIRASTFSGGQGVISGQIDMPRRGEDRVVLTRLKYDFSGEHFSQLLLSAIPPSFTGDEPPPAGWPGRTRAPVAQLLEALGVTATLKITGAVETQPDNSDAVTTSVTIVDGALSPTPRLPKVLRRFGLSWPAQMSLSNLKGQVEIAPKGLDIVHLQATRGGGSATALGHFTPDGEEGSLYVNIEGFPLSRDLIGIAEGADLEAGYRAWDALQPEGTFDGLVHWEKHEESASTEAKVRLLTLKLAGTQELTPVCGEFVYSDGAVQVRDLDLRGVGPDGKPVSVQANGSIMGSPDFTATATGLTLSSPLVAAGFRAGHLAGVSDTMRLWNLDGGFAAQLDVGVPAEGKPWRVTVHPTWISGVHEGEGFNLLVHEGAIVAGDDGVAFNGLRAGVMHGWLGLHGHIGAESDGATRGELSLSLQLAQWSEDVQALLPATAREALEGIEFHAKAPVTSDGLQINFRTPADGASSVTVDGRLEIAQGTFRAGTTFTEADGHLDFKLSTLDGLPEGFIDLEFARLFVVDREATRVTARLDFDAPTNSMSLDDMEADMYGGRLTGRARAVMGGAYTATVNFANVRFAPFAEAKDTPEQRLEQWRAREGHDGPGNMRGRFQLAGTFGKPDLQRGTGRLSVADARMMEFPLGMSILQLSQLMLPLNASLEKADVEFEIVGEVLTFERFVLASSTLRLEGSGSLSLSDGDLALRFRNRGTLPIVSDLFGAVVGDQMFMIDVQGTLQAPEPKLVPIPILAPEPTLPPSSHASRMTSQSND